MEVMKQTFRPYKVPVMRQFNTNFSQLLSLFSLSRFEKAIRSHRAQRQPKGFDCLIQFVAMLFHQAGRTHSLRGIFRQLSIVEGSLNHLHGGGAPKQSNISFCNGYRPWQLLLAQDARQPRFGLDFLTSYCFCE
jgi:hypothetical protein